MERERNGKTSNVRRYTNVGAQEGSQPSARVAYGGTVKPRRVQRIVRGTGAH